MSDTQSLDTARARVLEVAARFLLREVDGEALEALRSPQMCAALGAYDEEFAAYLETLIEGGEAALEECATQYCSLFVISRETCPYACAWLDGEPSETGAYVEQSARRWMSQLGVEVAPGEWGNLPRDHVAVLLGLLSLALHSPTEAGRILAREIVEQTLGWIPRWAQAVSERSDNPLYRAISRLAEHGVFPPSD